MAKYIKTFENNSAYVAYTGNSQVFVKPNLSYCIQEREVHLTSIKERTDMTLSVEDARVGETVPIVVNIAPIEECAVVLYVNNEIIDTINITDGRGQYLWAPDPGSYTAYVEFSGNSQYKPCSASCSFVVDKCESPMSIEGNEDTVTLTVSEDATGQISASVLGGQTYYSNVIDGKTTFDFSELLPSGTYSVTFQYLGDDYYYPSQEETETITVS